MVIRSQPAKFHIWATFTISNTCNAEDNRKQFNLFEATFTFCI